MRDYTVELTFARTEQKKHLVGTFTTDEWDSLLSYRKEGDRLIETVRTFAPTKVGIIMSFSYGQLTDVSSAVFSTRDRAALLHSLRPLILNDEPHCFNRTCSILSKKLRHGWMRQAIKWLGDHYRILHLQSKMQVVAGGTMIIADRMLYEWLNAYEYHRDQDKQKALQELERNLPNGLSEGIFAGMLMCKTEAVVWMRRIVEHLELADGTPLEMALASRNRKQIRDDAEKPDTVFFRSYTSHLIQAQSE